MYLILQVVAEYGSSSSSSVAEEPPDYDELTEMLYDACDQGAVQVVQNVVEAGANVKEKEPEDLSCPAQDRSSGSASLITPKCSEKEHFGSLESFS